MADIVDDKRRFTVSELTGADPYKLSTGLIVPRPIGWIGSLSADGVPNLAPYSFFNCVSGVPPMFVFSPGRGGRKDTLANVREVGEFTINIVTDEVAVAMNDTAATHEADVDEFVEAGLTAVPSASIRPPMVGECKANIECVVSDIIDIGDVEHGNALVIGEAVEFHVSERLLDGTRVDQAELRAVGRHVGNAYSHATDLFEIVRPP
ncbi:MAG: flavin reductase family protein [Ilumatobacter sp.]|uniref:flavin reductase family protein n=1 Tax=Ilumatobacter sp. TaxID=1967498 RepID=UPI00260D87A3|nr:flavin reductase family protein [Ilumatobacter sp.]MDJ0768949.1 flavin reductase family protein [Ilumatobacter sp.]